MSRANVVMLTLAASLAIGTTAFASGPTSGNIATPAQSATDSTAAQSQGELVMNIPLLVLVDGRGQIRDIQHSQRLPTDVNDLLWQNIRSWTKSSAVINGKHEEAQVFMNVTLHSTAQPDGKSNVYFTLASEGPVLRGYWFLRGNHLYGHCSLTGNMTGGEGGRSRWCSTELTPASAESAVK